jgi:hypothetical protein
MTHGPLVVAVGSIVATCHERIVRIHNLRRPVQSRRLRVGGDETRQKILARWLWPLGVRAELGWCTQANEPQGLFFI